MYVSTQESDRAAIVTDQSAHTAPPLLLYRGDAHPEGKRTLHLYHFRSIVGTAATTGSKGTPKENKRPQILPYFDARAIVWCFAQ